MKNNQNLDASSAPLSPPSSVNVVETNVENINTVVIENIVKNSIHFKYLNL